MATGRMKMSYMGPKDPETGERPEDPPVYVHQAVPCVLYHPDWPGFPREGKRFTTGEAAAQALAEGWVDNPSKLGHITEPSQQQIEDQRQAELDAKRLDAEAEAARKAEEAELIAEAKAARAAAAKEESAAKEKGSKKEKADA